MIHLRRQLELQLSCKRMVDPRMHIRTARLVLIAVLACRSAAWADGGSITGTIMDPSGAGMPAVTVTLRNAATGATETAVTSGDGTYLFPGLAVGRYGILIHQTNFQPFERSAIQVAGALTLDITLQLDHPNETLTVSTDGSAPDPADTQSGETLSGAVTRSVPLNGRSFTDLIALQPGVVPASSQQPNAVLMAGVTSTPPSGGLNPGNLSVSGQRESANGFVVNGSSVEETVNMGTAVVPNLDSIAELRVLTNNFNAEYGNYSGGQILVVTKSGANDFHGDAFEFLRNTALDARNFFSADRARFDQNQFGATLGGPVRRDRVFFFADYQGTRMSEGVDTGLIRVPSLADRTGELQDLARQMTGAVDGQYWANLLSEKLGYAVSPNEPYYTPGCANASQCVFPGAVVPQRAWSAPARSLMQYIPQPNAGADQFSTAAYDQTLGDNKGALRIDANSRWGMLSAYYFVDRYALNNPYPTAQGGASVPGFNALNSGLAQLASLSATKTFGANTVNEFHLSFMRNANVAGQPVGGVGPSLGSQGFAEGAGTPGIVPLVPSIEGIANVSFNDFTLGVDTTGLAQVNNTFQGSDNWSRVAGPHSFKFGAAVHYDQVNTHPDAQSNGSFDFLGSETGVDFADFLLGIPSSYTQADSQSFYNRNHYIGAYGQDSWRLRPNLTLNYGIRWDVIPPWREKYGQLQTLMLGEQSVVYPGAPTGLVFPGDPGIPSTLAPTRYGNLAPRAGLAWSPEAKTSVRAGYGMFYTAFEGLSAGIMSANPPYGYSYTSPAPPLFQTPFITAATGQNNGQRFPLPFPPFGASAWNPDRNVDWAMYLPLAGIPSFYRQNAPPYAGNFTLSIERQFAANTFLRMGYVGAQAHHLLVVEEANPGNAAQCLSLSQPADVMPGTATCGPFGESGTYTAASGQTVQGTRGPFPSAFGGVSYQKTIGNSNYNALEVTARHNAGPLELLAGYTYSKSLDQSSSLAEAVNPLNPSLDRAPSAFDMTHNFVASYRLAIPFLGGWDLSGITRFSTGFPVTLFNNGDTSLLGSIPNGINNNGVDTPDYTPGPLDLNRNPRNGEPAFNTALFSIPALGQLGTAARRFFYGPGIANFDMALAKSIRLAESRTLQLRLEAFNVWNHAQFYGPAAVNGNIESSNFGQIVSAAAPRLVQLAAKFSF
jgi:hypothetical protein